MSHLRPIRHIALSLATLSLALLASCGPAPEADPDIGDAIASCIYINGFSDKLECKEYLGSNWTDEAIRENCASPVPGTDPGAVEWGVGCDRTEILGVCEVDPGTVDSSNIVFLGSDAADCSGLQVGCNFAGGEYLPTDVCGGDYESSAPPPDREPFRPFDLVCKDPLPGEPPGDGPGGQVCTWEAISASTEEGRHFADYASCEPLYVQRPYWAARVEANTPEDDPRYSDPEWQEEFEWITGQIESSGCVCCHTTEFSPPQGPSGWYLEADGIWTDTIDDDGMAMMAGWIDSTAFGMFPPEDNNGFDRSITGTGSTDPLRMKAFFEGELARRGFVEGDFADERPFGGPLADQLEYVPSRCEGDVGVAADGTITWAGGGARYVYVMRADADNPGVPPNLDLPDGTFWRVDVRPDDPPISSGIRYGEVPDGARQNFPRQGAPAPLRPGFAYYLYVLQDIYAPITRCTFVAE